MSYWRKFQYAAPKRTGWVDCTGCYGTGCNPNRTRTCASCRGERGRYVDEKKVGDKILIPIPVDAEILSTKPISKVISRKDEPKYPNAQFSFKRGKKDAWTI